MDYDAVFSQDEVFGEAEIEGRTADTLNDFIEELDGYDLRGIGRRDFLGDIYEKLIPTDERKALGEFYTPHIIAEFIVNAVVDNPEDIILDPACGTGTFLTAAYKYKKDLGDQEHQQIVDQLVGVDVNRFAAHLAVINLARQNLEEKTERTNILINDFFELDGAEQHPLFSASADIDSEVMTDTEAREKVQAVNKRVKNVDGVVANPPYISWTQISPERRKRMRTHLPHKYREGNTKISGKSDIYQYFFTASLEGLDDGDKLGFLTSYKWTTVQGGRNLMTYLLNNSRIKAIIGFNKSLFEDALVNTYITILEKQDENNDTENIRNENNVSFIRVEDEIDPEKLTTLMNSDTTVQGEGYRVIQQRQADLHDKEKWSRFIVAPKEYFEIIRHPLVTDITDVCEMSAATGTKTQADDFFVIEEETLEKWNLSKEYLTPAIISKRQIENEQFLFSESDSDKYFLDLHDLTIDIINEVENSSIVGDELQSQVNEEVIEERLKEYLRENGDGGLADYIEHGKSEYINFDDPNDNIHGRGETWWDLGDLAGPRLVMIETRQHRPGVLWNEDQIPVKDTGRPFYAESGLESDEKVIAGILNSSIGRIFIESHGRISGGSAIRMMVYDLKSLPMLDLDQMSNDVKTEISSAFEKWIKADTHSDFDEKLDRAVLSAFDEFEENSDNEDGNGENWESRWETFQDKAERMKEIRNDSREVKLLLDDEEGEELENVVDSGAKVNKTLDDF